MSYNIKKTLGDKACYYNKGGEQMSKKISAILFSGGLDSSLAVCDMIEKGYDVHLLHYDTGALISNNLINIRYAELKKTYEEYIVDLY